jgi:hypothetical protein
MVAWWYGTVREKSKNLRVSYECVSVKPCKTLRTNDTRMHKNSIKCKYIFGLHTLAMGYTGAAWRVLQPPPTIAIPPLYKAYTRQLLGAGTLHHRTRCTRMTLSRVSQSMMSICILVVNVDENPEAATFYLSGSRAFFIFFCAFARLVLCFNSMERSTNDYHLVASTILEDRLRAEERYPR